MNRDGRDVADGLHIPNFAEKFVLGVDVVGVLREEGEEVKFFGGELGLFAVDPDAPRGLVDFDAADFDDVVLVDVGADEAVVP